MSAAEDLSPEVEQRRADVVRICGAAMVFCDAAVRAREELETAIDVLARAREAAEEALEKCRAACELAERMSVFAARVRAGAADPTATAQAADALAEMFG